MGRQLGGKKQYFVGKPYGYASPTALREVQEIQPYLQNGSKAMMQMGFQDLMFTEQISPQLNETTAFIANNMHPPPRSILLKHPLGAGGETEPVQVINGV